MTGAVPAALPACGRYLPRATLAFPGWARPGGHGAKLGLQPFQAIGVHGGLRAVVLASSAGLLRMLGGRGLRRFECMNRFSVVIAGGGVAALEALLRLRRLAATRWTSPFSLPTRTSSIAPCRCGNPSPRPPERHPVGPLVAHADAEWVKDTLKSVELERRIVHTGGAASSPSTLWWSRSEPANAVIDHARTFDDAHADEMLRGLVQDIEGGYVRKLAFVKPARPGAAPAALRAGADGGAESPTTPASTIWKWTCSQRSPAHCPGFGAKSAAVVATCCRRRGSGSYLRRRPRSKRTGHLQPRRDRAHGEHHRSPCRG